MTISSANESCSRHSRIWWASFFTASTAERRSFPGFSVRVTTRDFNRASLGFSWEKSVPCRARPVQDDPQALQLLEGACENLGESIPVLVEGGEGLMPGLEKTARRFSLK